MKIGDKLKAKTGIDEIWAVEENPELLIIKKGETNGTDRKSVV